MAALDGDVDRLAEQRGHLGRPQATLDEPADGLLDVAVVEHLDRAAHGVGDGDRRPLGVRRHGEPPTEPLADVDAGERAR